MITGGDDCTWSNPFHQERRDRWYRIWRGWLQSTCTQQACISSNERWLSRVLRGEHSPPCLIITKIILLNFLLLFKFSLSDPPFKVAFGWIRQRSSHWRTPAPSTFPHPSYLIIHYSQFLGLPTKLPSALRHTTRVQNQKNDATPNIEANLLCNLLSIDYTTWRKGWKNNNSFAFYKPTMLHRKT